MKFIDFAFKLFGYEKRNVTIGSKEAALAGTAKTVKKYVKVHPQIFGLVIYNALEMFTDWYRSRILGLGGLIHSEKAAKFAIENPMNTQMKIGYIQAPEYKKEEAKG